MQTTAYFDNAATSFPKPEVVYSFMDSFYRSYGVNVGRGQHKLAFQAANMVEETRALLLQLFHCPSRQVIFAPSSTEALNIIIQGQKYFDGCNIYISPFEHNSVTRILHHIEKERAITVKQLPVDRSSLQYDLVRLKADFIKNRPHYVIISHASNVCGVVAPIFPVCEAAKEYGATTIIDMSQTAGLVDTDLNNDNIDYAVFAGHKTLYGPFGISGFIAKSDTELRPLIFGGTGSESANQEMPAFLPARLEAGSVNVAALAGLNASLKWLHEKTSQVIHKKEKENRKTLISVLSAYPHVHIVGAENSQDSIGIVSCVFEGYSPDSIGQVLSDQSVAVRTGLHCSPIAHRFLGTFPAGTVRFSTSYFTSQGDFDILMNALNYIEEYS
ncbi:putative cysteine desulfurase [bioreactor metagenome]|uniref:Putative cysteine desulfurase n=1 Tax=bioreactor metagenome TaxID=1076179 RepID=A0A644W342_9ZZZZ